MAYLVTKENTKYKTFTDEYAFHGLKRDSTGLLIYTKVPLSSDEEVEVTTGEGISYGGLKDLQDNKDNNGDNINESAKGVNEGVASYLNNSGKRNYDQIRFDENNLIHFMDADGFLVARYLKDFTFSNTANGATRNWKA